MATILLNFYLHFFISVWESLILCSVLPGRLFMENFMFQSHMPASFQQLFPPEQFYPAFSVQESLPNWEQQRSPLFQRVLPQSLY